ncbi:MAG: tyrosine--tRNA ligase [Actinomycetes bacterium]
MVTTSEDLRARGLVHQVTDEGLFDQLDAGGVTLYAGFDPTADSLHVGHLLQVCTLRRLQIGGNRPIALAGGGTGMIGDPGGKSEERPLLSLDEIASNVASIRGQLSRFLDFDESAGRSQALLLDNAAWLGELSLLEFLRDTGKHFTVNQMVAKESVKSRLERPDQGISFTEFSYMLLQAYDFARLHEDHGCTLQVGGSDQWGNITMGIELVRKRTGAHAFGLTSPLVTKADGTKFGKSEGGTDRVWLDAARTSPYRLYQFLLQAEDAVVGSYLRFFTFLDLEEIDVLDRQTAEEPHLRASQRALAASVIDLVHGEAERKRAEEASRALFSGAVASLDEATLLDVASEVPSTVLSAEGLAGRPLVIDVVAGTDLVASKGEARRAIEQGGIFVNDVPRLGLDATLGPDDLLHGRYLVLRKGKRSYHLISVQ